MRIYDTSVEKHFTQGFGIRERTGVQVASDAAPSAAEYFPTPHWENSQHVNFRFAKSSKMAHFVLKCNKEDYLSQICQLHTAHMHQVLLIHDVLSRRGSCFGKWHLRRQTPSTFLPLHKVHSPDSRTFQPCTATNNKHSGHHRPPANWRVRKKKHEHGHTCAHVDNPVETAT